jgi:DNA-binding MarR family transcriptional regulator
MQLSLGIVEGTTRRHPYARQRWTESRPPTWGEIKELLKNAPTQLRVLEEIEKHKRETHGNSLSNAEIGKAIGSSKQAVNTALKALADRNLISFDRCQQPYLRWGEYKGVFSATH